MTWYSFVKNNNSLFGSSPLHLSWHDSDFSFCESYYLSVLSGVQYIIIPLLTCQWRPVIALHIRGTLRDLVPFVQFRNVKNTHGGVLLLVKLKAEACKFTKSNTSMGVFHVFKIVQMVPNRATYDIYLETWWLIWVLWIPFVTYS